MWFIVAAAEVLEIWWEVEDALEGWRIGDCVVEGVGDALDSVKGDASGFMRVGDVGEVEEDLLGEFGD